MPDHFHWWNSQTGQWVNSPDGTNRPTDDTPRYYAPATFKTRTRNWMMIFGLLGLPVGIYLHVAPTLTGILPVVAVCAAIGFVFGMLVHLVWRGGAVVAERLIPEGTIGRALKWAVYSFIAVIALAWAHVLPFEIASPLLFRLPILAAVAAVILSCVGAARRRMTRRR